jgi:hypothetical protein
LYQFEDTVWITVPHIDISKLDKDFFEAGKNYLISLLVHSYYASKFFLNTYFYDKPLSREEAITFLQAYTRAQFQSQCVAKISA